MKYFAFLVFLNFAIIACSKPETKPQAENTQQYADTTQLSRPDTEDYEKSKVSVDSVKAVEQGLLIAGTLPDGCSKLHKASHSMKSDTPNITLSAWRPSDKMCTQVLKPFTYIYEELSEQQVNHAAAVIVNSKKYILN